tara:strand:- start:3637 stop:4212 length:576 start_codon:yes stop_codon:yes gene_type:complete
MKFNSHKWIREFKSGNFNEAKKESQVNLEDLAHTKKWDKDPSKDPKADKKPKAKLGADNDLAIEKDKEGNDIFGKGLKERLQKLSGQKINEEDKPVKPFQPGDMWSNDFDYIGMLKWGADANVETMDLATLNAGYESFTDVNYHTEGRDLGLAIEWLEDNPVTASEHNRIEDFMSDFNSACEKTLKEIERR